MTNRSQLLASLFSLEIKVFLFFVFNLFIFGCVGSSLLHAPRHVGSSQTRARTRVPCIGRQILNHCTTKEARD